MKIIAISFAVLAVFCSPTLADETYPQIMIRAEFLSVPKAVLDNVQRNTPDQLPSAKLILGFKQSGQATVLHSPTVLMQAGQESTVKSVEEVIYPTDLAVTSQSATNAVDRPIVITAFTPSDFETREVGAIFTALPELDAKGLDIFLTFQAELVAPPVWMKYKAQYTDSLGNTKTGEIEQPFFRTQSVNTSVRIKNGTTVLAGGGISDERKESVTFLLITAQLVDSREQPMTVEQDKSSVRGKPRR
ncbi:MAG: hypothetical protein R6V03_09740 [Kiritimatiellia bacterium]